MGMVLFLNAAVRLLVTLGGELLMNFKVMRQSSLQGRF